MAVYVPTGSTSPLSPIHDPHTAHKNNPESYSRCRFYLAFSANAAMQLPLCTVLPTALRQINPINEMIVNRNRKRNSHGGHLTCAPNKESFQLDTHTHELQTTGEAE